MDILPARLVAGIKSQLAATKNPPTPGQIGRLIDPRTIQTPALDLIDQELEQLLKTPDGRLIISLAPQEGKSSRVSRDFVIHTLTRNPDTRVVMASYSQGLANRNGRTVRNAIASHPELDIQIAADHGAAAEWSLARHRGGVRSVGRGAGIVGHPAELIIIDDPLKDRTEADSETTRETCWSWWTESLSTRLAPGAPVVLIMTRWHTDDLAGRLLAAEDGHLWRVLNIPAQADHRPEHGETDPLGRQPGEWMQSARGRTPAQWEAIRRRVGTRGWNAQYQGRPSPAEGGMIKRAWWRRYDTPQWTVRDDGVHIAAGFDELLISADLAFKGTATSDYVAIGVWGRRSTDIYLLDQTHGRMNFVETQHRFVALCHKWPQAILKLIEDKANGPALISQLSRHVPGLVPVEPKGSKLSRANAWAPLAESGHMWLPADHLAPWVEAYIDECAAFPNGAHDDQVDQTSMAADRLLVRPLLQQQPSNLLDLDEYRIGY